MVRRWSYINSTNTLHLKWLKASLDSAFDANINTTMYLRRPYAENTILTRRQWAKRKHLHNWLALSNVLKDWAKSYRFYRNYNKFVYNQHFTSSSFLAFNVLRSRSISPALTRGAESVVTSSVSRKWVKYFASASNARWSAVASLRNALPMWVSVPTSKSDLKVLTANPTLVPLLNDSVSFLAPIDQSAAATKASYSSVLSALYGISLKSLTSSLSVLYRILIKLSLTRLK